MTITKAQEITSSDIDRSAEADANRFRWLLDGNGYFMEEEMLCGHGRFRQKEADEARQRIDEAMGEGRI